LHSDTGIYPVGLLARYYGGWAAPNIYFLGFAGVIKFGNIRIGGLSGIYKPGYYNLGKFMNTIPSCNSYKFLMQTFLITI